MTRAHAAFAKPAEGQLASDQMHDRVVDACATRADFIQEPVLNLAVVREGIHRQRHRLRALTCDDLIEIVKRAQWQDRTKNFFSEQWRIVCDLRNDRRREVEVICIARATAFDLRAIKQRAKSIEVPAVDDASVGCAALRVIAEKFADRFGDGGDELAFDSAVDPHMVGRDTGLAGIEKFPPHDSPRGDFDIRIGTNDGRAFPAEFERDRCEVLRRGTHHFASHARAAGEKDRVKLLAQQSGGRCFVALHHRDEFRRKNFADQARDRRAGVGREFGWFQDRAVARRNGAHQWPEQQLHRVIPRTNDQGHAHRLRPHARARRPGHPRFADFFFTRPRGKVLERMANLAGDHADLRRKGIVRAFAQIRMQRFEQNLLV